MHPLVKILCFISVLLLIGMVNSTMLFFITIFSFVLTFSLKIQSFSHAVWRMRWLFLSILIIYAFDTPGELLPQFPVNFAPTYEGFQLGLMQAEKLLVALATLSLLLTSSPRAKMMLGLYMLLSPFKYIGLNVERFAARLMLTLDYVEELAAQDKSNFGFKLLDEIDGYVASLPQENIVSFQRLPFNFIDKLILFLLLVIFVFMIYRGFA